MQPPPLGTVLIGDILGSRRDARAASVWLRALRDELDEQYAAARIAPFEYTQGDELQGLLAPDADPFHAVLVAAFRPGPLRMRWVVRFGGIDEGDGPATQRTGPAYLEARTAMDRLERAGDALGAGTGDARADPLLGALAPVFGEMLAELTDRQREVARLLLLEGRRQVDAAKVLRVAPPTVSVSAQRAHLRSITRLRAVLLALYREGVAGVTGAPASREPRADGTSADPAGSAR